MFAVVGSWTLDLAQADQQRSDARGIADRVRQLPGFVCGFWSHDSADPSRHLTWIVFTEREQAEAFASMVRGNRTAQEASGVTADDLRIAEIDIAELSPA